MGIIIFIGLAIGLLILAAIGASQHKKRIEILELGHQLMREEDLEQMIVNIHTKPTKNAQQMWMVEAEVKKEKKEIIIYLPSNAKRRFQVNDRLPIVYSARQNLAVIHPDYVEWLNKQGKQLVSNDAGSTTDPMIIYYLDEESSKISDGSTDGGFDTSSDSSDGGDGGGSD